MYMIDEVEEIPYSEEDISRIPSITGYIVKSGDTLWNIAKHYGTTIEKMKQYNENLTEPLETGQKLFLLNGKSHRGVTSSTCRKDGRLLAGRG